MATTRSPTPTLVGRAAECERIGEMLVALRRGTGGAIVLRGPPGVGKTSLLDWTVAQATDMTVLTARGVDREGTLPFSLLGELLEPVGWGRPEVERLGGSDRFAAGLALVDTLSSLAERVPVLVVIDDVQWADASSIDALWFAARRLGDDPVGFVAVTIRISDELALFPAELVVLELDGLSIDAACTLVADRVAPSVAREIARATGGNPLAVLELTAALDADERAGRTPLADPLPVAPSIEQAYLRRTTELSVDARRLLLLAAADPDLTVDVLLAAAHASAIDTGALAELEASGLFSTDAGLHFAHPLLRSTFYYCADSRERRAAHRALAGTLRRSTDGDRRALHLAAAADAPDELVASALEAAAIRARESGASAVAGDAFDRSAGLTPEPEPRSRRFMEAGRVFWMAGLHERAMRAFDDALESAPHQELRADVQLERLRSSRGRSFADIHRELVEEAERTIAVDPLRAARLFLSAWQSAFAAGQPDTARVAAGRAVELASGAVELKRLARLMRALADYAIGESSRAFPVFHEFVASVERFEPGTETVNFIEPVAIGLMWAEEWDLVEKLTSAAIDNWRAQSAIGNLPPPLVRRAAGRLWRGEWLLCLADATEAAELARESGDHLERGYALSTLAAVEGGLGHFDAGRTHGSDALECAATYDLGYLTYLVHTSLGFLELSAGRPDDAVGHLLQTQSLADAMGIRNPSALRRQRDLVEVLVMLGRLDEARCLATRIATDATTWPSSGTRAIAAYCRGMVAVDAATSDSCFDEARRALAQSSSHYQRARAELAYGEMLQRTDRHHDAVPMLARARKGFVGSGAVPWVARADRALGASGRPDSVGTVAGLDRLTARELQVAFATASGQSSRETAAALFLSRRTVEYHLASVYRKLGIRSRVQLANLLRGLGSTAEDDDRTGPDRSP